MSANSSREQESNNGREVVNDQVYQVVQGVLWALLVAWPIMFLGNKWSFKVKKPNPAVQGTLRDKAAPRS